MHAQRPGQQLPRLVRDRDPGRARYHPRDCGPAGQQVAGHHHGDGPQRDCGQRPRRPACRPGRPEQEEHERCLDRDGGADQQASGKPASSTQPTQAEQAEDARGRGQPIDVAAAEDGPQHQRIHRPQQVRARPGSLVRPEQEVKGQRHREEGQRVLYLEPEDRPRCRGAGQE